MTREEWRRVKDIAAAVLAEAVPDRAPVIDALCGSDPGLRAEVESLLGSVEASAHLFENPTLLIAGAGAALETLHSFEANRIG